MVCTETVIRRHSFEEIFFVDSTLKLNWRVWNSCCVTCFVFDKWFLAFIAWFL